MRLKILEKVYFCGGIVLFLPLLPLHTELYVSPRVITRFNIGEVFGSVADLLTANSAVTIILG